MSNDQVVLGRISGLYGVRGWIKVYSYTEQRENILDYADWDLGGARYRLEQGKVHGKGIIAKLGGIEDRDAAAALIGRDISVSRESLPEPQKDEYYWSDLEGCRVTNREGDDLGEVNYLFATGANDVMVIKGERERLLPFIGSVILAVDLEGKSIQVDWDKEF